MVADHQLGASCAKGVQRHVDGDASTRCCRQPHGQSWREPHSASRAEQLHRCCSRKPVCKYSSQDLSHDHDVKPKELRYSSSCEIYKELAHRKQIRNVNVGQLAEEI